MQSIFTFNHVSFEFPNGRELFNDLNFSLDKKITGLIGPNGVGKSSLAKLIIGELEPTRGQVFHYQSATLFAQRQIAPLISVENYLADDYSFSVLGEKLLETVNRHALCSQLSGGEWMRVRLAKSIHNQFLILDEPTNDLDREGRKTLLHFLKSYSYGVLLISHDREALQLCDQILELSNQGLMKFSGNWNEYELARNHERQTLSENLEEAKKNREQLNKKRQEQKAKQEKRNRRGTDQAAKGGIPKILLGGMKRRAQVTTAKIDVATLDRANSAVQEAYEAYNQIKNDPVMYANLIGQQLPNQKLIAEAFSFNIRFKDWLYSKDLTFTWRGNIRVNLKGANGSGKSSLLKAILGQKFETKGQMKVGSLHTLYVDQRCSILNDELSIFENIQQISNLDESEIRNNLAKFLFTKEMVFQKAQSLSGGERLRAALAKGLLSTEKPELLILDEPTNNLDLLNIQFLENLVSAFKGALLIISHDEVFLKNCRIEDELWLK